MKHRLLMPDGRIKYVLENLETQCDAEGNPVRIIGTTQDITHQHHLEARMQLLASAFEHSGESILITDRENRIVAVNPAFTRLTGYSAEDALGCDPKMLSAGRTSRDEYRKMWEALTERDFWQGEIWDRRRDGTVYPKWLSISVIRDDEGAVAYYVAHFTDVTMERATEAKLHHMAHHDVLTGLLNRFSLGNRLDQALALARRNSTRVALLFIDLDRFKVINDTLGHQVGDALLVEVAERLRASVRETDVVARLGGDEFVVMLTGIEQAEVVAAVAEKLVFNVGSPYLLGENQLYTTPSIGIALYPNDGETADVLMKNADAAMYHAKNAGRNNFQFFDARMNDMAIERLGIENALRQALKRDEFVLHFQPVLDVASGRVVSVEALVRWQHPERGLLMPGAFIDIAEESGLIQPIGDWVFWAACRQLASFQGLGINGVRMGINISAIQMRNSSLPVMVQGALDAYDLKASDLVLEITESAAMDKPEQTVVLLDKLHSMGVNLAIDDFGTGYSSLGYLRMFPISHLKLDRSFVEEIQRGGRSVICDATIGLAHNLGMRIVAEGVETEEQLEYLRARQCDLAQGYYFSRPVSADAVIEFIRRCNS
jgi:diguanylate cyclase (GGDEF)-like protein/PAS domain S-box-containing protein